VPRINTRFAAGPLDDVVYRAAEVAGMPEVVASRYEGGEFFWRWVTSSNGLGVRSVVLRIGPRPDGAFTAVVGVETCSHAPTPRPCRWEPIGQTTLPSFGALDEEWLAAQLRRARA